MPDIDKPYDMCKNSCTTNWRVSMNTLNISDVRNSLPSVIEEVVQFNQIVVVTRYGKPVARIVPFRGEEDQASCYTLRDKPIKMADDFDEPMPELWNAVNE